MMRLNSYLEKQSKTGIYILSLAIIIFIGIFDYLIGPEISTSIFYVLPISIAAWYGGQRQGIAYSLISAVVWMVTDRLSGMQFSHISIMYWNAFVRLGLFLIIARLLSTLRQRLKIEEEAADIDALTGAFNSRVFHEFLESESQRSRRYGHHLSLAFIDLDNFKFVNDNYGHQTGDLLLKKIVNVLQEQTRKTDLIARIGGDEFVVLFVEAGSTESVVAARSLQGKLLLNMQENNWPVTFSIGLVTFETMPDDYNLMIKTADDLMYDVKKNGKNNIIHQVVGGGAVESGGEGLKTTEGI